jgi:anaerobic ribonucleoside-triphosphate reductase activating protein
MKSSICLHDIIQNSRVNGSGSRCVLWTQGCSKKCPNCYNPEMWDFNGGEDYNIDILVEDIIDSGCDGVTISGGDPFEQPEALYNLLVGLNKHLDKLPMGIIVFTGYTIEEINENSVAKNCIILIDLIIDGRYVDGLRHESGISGSSNQGFIYNNEVGRGKDRIGEEVEIDQDVEIYSKGDDYVLTGFPLIDKDQLAELGIEFITED